MYGHNCSLSHDDGLHSHSDYDQSGTLAQQGTTRSPNTENIRTCTKYCVNITTPTFIGTGICGREFGYGLQCQNVNAEAGDLDSLIYLCFVLFLHCLYY